MHQSLNLDEELKNIFQKCLNKAKQAAIDEMKLHPNHYIISIQSQVLDYGINHHLKNINDSSIDELLTLFEKVDQSNKAKERESICNGLFTVDVMTIQTKGRNRKRKLVGAGRRELEFSYNLYEGALYEHQPFPNGYCLFFALEWIRQKHLLTKMAYQNWRNNRKRQMNDVKKLMAACGIQEGLPEYSIMDCGRHIQVIIRHTT